MPSSPSLFHRRLVSAVRREGIAVVARKSGIDRPFLTRWVNQATTGKAQRAPQLSESQIESVCKAVGIKIKLEAK